MGKLYGTLGGDGRAKPQNRIAQTETYATSRSYQGSITTTIWIKGSGEHMASIEIAPGSNIKGRELWSGTLADLIGAKRIEIQKGGSE